MPIGEFPDFATCEAHFAKDPHVENPAALCAYIEDRSKDDSVQDGNKVIYGLDVEFMSYVDTPAVDSMFLKAKSRDDVRTFDTKDLHGRMMKSKASNSDTGQGMFIKCELDEKNYIVKGVALIPDVVDGNGEAVSREEIYKASIKFMESRKVDSQHDFEEGKGDVVFNWVLDKATDFDLMHGGTKTYPAGTWLVGTKVRDPKEWDLIKSGKRKGFSIAGYWSAVPISKSKSAEPEPEPEDKSQSPSTPEESTKQVKAMPDEPKPITAEDVTSILKKELAAFLEATEDEKKRKEAEVQAEKIKADLATAQKEIEDLKKALKEAQDAITAKADGEEDKKPEDEEEKAEGDPEDDPEDKPEEEKTIEEKMVQERNVIHRATKGREGPIQNAPAKGARNQKALIQGYKSNLKVEAKEE